MNKQTALDELETLAKTLGVQVVYDNLRADTLGGGGLCKVKGNWRIFVDKKSSVGERVSMLARCLSRFDIETHFVSPGVRDLLSKSEHLN